MCGIFGIVHKNSLSVPDDLRLQESLRLLGHRGPDSYGLYTDQGVGLAHTRLSLLDLSERGHQPLKDDSSRYVIVYNGEIYNFKHLRGELERRGIQFTSECDTEVLLKGIIHFGVDDFLPRLEGMFAFGLWDSHLRRVILCRDRFGMKPLSYYEDEHILVFSSEVKAMSPWVRLQPNAHMISAYLSGFGGPTRDRSFFHDVCMLAPGTIKVSGNDSHSSYRKFFHLTEFWRKEECERMRRLDEGTIVNEVEEKLFASVEKHLVSDAPVGAFCSGGLDSSLVMAMASRIHPNLAIFHANVQGPLSEVQAAEELSKHLGLELLTVDVRDQDFLEHLPETVWHYEYPISYHPNSVPFLLVSRLVKSRGVKAVLSGEGSDECFLGYGRIAYEDLGRRYRRALGQLRGLVHRIPKLGKSLWPMEHGHCLEVQEIQSNFENSLDRLAVRERVAEVGLNLPAREHRSLDWLGYHLRSLLHRNDALGMAASIEARFPYLDNPLVQAAVALPYRFKIRPSIAASDRAHPFLRDKWIVRAIADRYMPRVLSQRKKIGFPVNAFERMRIPHELFYGGFVADHFRLANRPLRYMLDSTSGDLRMRLLMLEIWGRLYLRGGTISNLSQQLMNQVVVEPIATS